MKSWWDWVVAWCRDLWYFVIVWYSTIRSREKNLTDFEPASKNLSSDNQGSSPRSRKLAILIHGLHGSPRNWRFHREELSRRGWDTLIPHLPHGGNCSMEENLAAICRRLEEIMRHDDRRGYAKMAILGESNGSRIMHHLRVRLIDWFFDGRPTKDIRMVAVAGFYYGIPWLQSTFIQWILKWSGFIHPEILRTFRGEDEELQSLLRPQSTMYLVTEHDTRGIPWHSGVCASSPAGRAAPHLMLPCRPYGHCSVKFWRIDRQIDFIESEWDESIPS